MKLALNLVLAALVAAPALANPLPARRPGTKRWIVTFQPSIKRDGRDKILGELKLKATAHIATDGDSQNEFSSAIIDVAADKDSAASLDEAKSRAAAGADIVSVEPDVRVKWIESAAISFQGTPMPSFASVVAGLNVPKPDQFPVFHAAAVRGSIPWGINRVHAPAAWPSPEGAGVKVAIIDTGIDYNHPALAGKVDGGYSAITKTENPQDYMDDNGHGTHVSGTAAGQRIQGLVGVAPKARLYAVKVLDADGSGNLSDVVDGIVWAAKNGMQVANMSLGAPTDSEAMHRAVRMAKGMGVVIVAAAGNSGKPDGTGGEIGYPGAYGEAVITVAASDYADKIAVFSSHGKQVKFVAPGVDVVSAKMGGGFVSYSGTSMATPHVTGLAALSAAQGWVGMGGPDGIMAQLQKAASPLPNLTDEQQGAGMIDAGKLTR